MPYVTFVYDLISYLHFFRMLHLHHRVVVDDHHLDVADHQQVHRQFLVYLIYKEMKMVRHQYVVENLHLLMVHLMLVVLHLDVLQILDEQSLDAIQSFLDAEHRPVNLEDVAVDGVLRPLLKMDCYLDEVDAEPHHLLKMDCYLGEVQVLMELQVLRHLMHGLRRDLLPHALLLLLCWQLILLAQALALRYQRQVRRQVQRLVQRSLHPLALLQLSWQQPS
jgi:hypothetical protein